MFEYKSRAFNHYMVLPPKCHLCSIFFLFDMFLVAVGLGGKDEVRGSQEHLIWNRKS